MIDIHFIPDGWERTDTWIGVFHGEGVIRIGCSDLVGWDQLVREGYAMRAYREYKGGLELIRGTVEEAVIHETLHIILKRWFGLAVSGELDNVDSCGEISNPGFR